jgi:transcription-repair coupling factor (superfamily II helicase)
MILPFVRERLADLEHCEPFERVRRHLVLAAGRKRVSGLTATARALYLPLFARAANTPVVVIVADNKAADALQLTLRAACELTGAIDPASVLKLPAHDVLPFENMSPHPDVQEQRASVLWKIATGAASVVIVPVEAACMRVFAAPYYAKLGRVLRRNEEIDIDALTNHLASVGYTPMDIVEMPGQFTRRGGIFDVYSPEADRPVRMELFGDEIESIRKFEPDSQRSSTAIDETLLLPLTETPISEELLAAVHQHLSGSRLDAGDDPELLSKALTAGGVSVFPGWEFFCAVAGADRTLFDLFPKLHVFQEEPAMIRNQADRWWSKVEQRHDRSGIGQLITPADI